MAEYQPQEIRLTLLQLLEDRYRKKSIIITSKLPVAKWYEYINDATLAYAIMNRMIANAIRVELKRKSLGYTTSSSYTYCHKKRVGQHARTVGQHGKNIQ